MSTEKHERSRIAAGLLQCEPHDVQAHVRVMTKEEREALSGRIDGVIAWVAEYDRADASRESPTTHYNRDKTGKA